MSKSKKSVFDNPLLSSKVKSAKPKLFPEGILGYFAGPTLALIANSFLASYFNKYLTDIYGITSWAATFNTLLPVVSVIFVVLGNILVGRLMDRNKSRAGKARPLLLLSLPASLLALLTLFIFTPFADQNSAQNVQITSLVLIAVGYNLWFAIAYPLYFTPHSALVNLSTRSNKDRSLLATLSNACNLAAMGLCTMIIPFFLGLLFNYDMTGGPGTVPVVNDAGVVQYYKDAAGRVLYNIDSSLAAWKVFAIVLVAVTAVGVILEYYLTRERVTEESFALASKEENAAPKKTISVREQWKICRRDKFWVIIAIFFFLYQFGGMIKNVSQLYYCTAWFPDAQGNYTTVSGGEFSGILAIVGAVPTALGMVIAYPLSNKIGKGKAILFGAIISAIGGAIGFLVPVVPASSRFIITVVSFVIKALGSTPAMYLSIALLGDILDHQEALHGKRTDGLSMTVYGAIMAGMTGIVTGILNGVLAASGYTPEAPQVTQTAMLWVFVGGETICYVAIAILFIFMRVERFSDLDHKAIETRQKAEAEAAGQEYVPTAVRLQREEEASDAKALEESLKQLEVRCQKKGLDFEKEKEAYLADIAAKQQKSAEAASAKKAKQEAAAKAKADKQQAKLDAMSADEKAAYEAKQAKKEEKKQREQEKVRADFEAEVAKAQR